VLSAAFGKSLRLKKTIFTVKFISVSALITLSVKTLVQRVLNAAETGTADGAYHDITIVADGKGGTRQITYGKSQTTEQGNLAKLIRLYCDKGGKYAAQLTPYQPVIGVKPLVDDSTFKNLLSRAGKDDPVMKQAQDEFFDEVYWEPAFEWFKKNEFTLPLSMLVIYDSYIHSGRILDTLRKRFAEPVPARNGNEKKWIEEYTKIRHQWLANHSKRILRKTVYRTNTYLGEIARNNWNLEMLPINMNGIAVNMPAGTKTPVA
jgi:chitosanase